MLGEGVDIEQEVRARRGLPRPGQGKVGEVVVEHAVQGAGPSASPLGAHRDAAAAEDGYIGFLRRRATERGAETGGENDSIDG